MTETPDPHESPAALRQTTLRQTTLRQAARLEDVPEIYRKTHERLAVELALHVDDAGEIFLGDVLGFIGPANHRVGGRVRGGTGAGKEA